MINCQYTDETLLINLTYYSNNHDDDKMRYSFMLCDREALEDARYYNNDRQYYHDDEDDEGGSEGDN